MPDVNDLRPGDPESIAGYRVLSRLGSGGQGVVFLAAAASGDLVAIKRLLHGPEDTQARAQFAKEVAAARLVAPFCTAQVVDAQLDGDAPYVVSEFIQGPSLQQQIQRNGPIQGTKLQRMAIGTVTALAAIHQAGVVHRDFKPANVMISPEGPRVIDFGIARDLSTETTVTSRIFGTPAYMSPEQLRAEVVGPASDMFAWASVIVYAATGRAPFDAPHMMAVMYRISAGEPDLTGVPTDLIEVLRHCLEKDPDRRPTAQQALAQLLGRSVSERDQTDPSMVLAEATGLVRLSDSGPSVLKSPVAPTPFGQSSFGPPSFDQSPGQPLGQPGPPSFDQASFDQPSEQPIWGSLPGEPAGFHLNQPGSGTHSGQNWDPGVGTGQTGDSDVPGQPVWGTDPTLPVSELNQGQPAWDNGRTVPVSEPYRGQSAWGTGTTGVVNPPSRRFRGLLVGVAVLLALVFGGAVLFVNVLDWLGSSDYRALEDDLAAYEDDATTAADAVASAAARPKANAPLAVPSAGASDRGKKGGGKGSTVVVGDAIGIPAAFAGTWKGEITVIASSTISDSGTAKLTLADGAKSGRLKFPDLGCSGTVTVSSVLVVVLTLDVEITQDLKGQCPKRSQIYATLGGKDTMQFNLVDARNAWVVNGSLER